MEPNQPEILDSVFTEKQKTKRRELLPWWIKTFAWIFMIFGTLAVLCLILGLFGMRVDLAFYGLETNEPLTAIGLSVIAIGLLKGFAAFSLWTEKDYAITVGQIDAIAGILICFVVMMYPLVGGQDGSRFNFRVELLLLIPFLVKLRNIKGRWENQMTSQL